MTDKSKPKKSSKKPEAREAPKERYFGAVGRRKTAVARARIFTGVKEAKMTVNGVDYQKYFKFLDQRLKSIAPLENLKLSNLSVSVKVRGGGLMAQAEAVRHALARALAVLNPVYKKRLRDLGYLTRDPRMVERKKYGLKKARRAPQWKKR